MSGTSNNPFAWLGLLKWSLSYSDGTQSTTATPMSAEDKAFLEAVMREGIIDENERMKTILKEVTSQMEDWKDTQNITNEDEVEDLLQELRDICEQIDYARAFAAMKGLPFLIGCASERDLMPRGVRALCLGIVATMCQHNPPVQQELLDMGAIKSLSDLFFLEANNVEESEHESKDDDKLDRNGMIRSRIIQAISAMVRSHELAESVFSKLEQSTALIESGLGVDKPLESTPLALRKRALFFLQALVTSDTSNAERIYRFRHAIGWCAVSLTDRDKPENDSEVREMCLAMIDQMLEQRKSVNCLLEHKTAIVGVGVRCVAAMRVLSGEDGEMTQNELDLWERVIQGLARASPDVANSASGDPVLLIDQGSESDRNQLLSQ
jgi:hsp70-interacting protein